MVLYVPLLKSCTTLRALLPIHTHLTTTGLHRDAPLSTKLIESYAKIGTIAAARLIFDSFSIPDPFMWGMMIKSYVWNHHYREAISLYHDGMCYHQLQLSSFIFPPVLNACCGLSYFALGRKVHGRVVKSGLESDAVVATSLIQMYGKGGSLDDAYMVFDEMPVRDVVSWNLMISSFILCGQANASLQLFSQMSSENIECDSVMMLTVAEAFVGIGFLRQAKEFHGHMLRRWSETDERMENSLVAMYNRCCDLGSAEKLFRNTSKRNVVSSTVMISSYNQRACFGEAFDVFTQMLKSEVEPSSVTMVSILSSCNQLGLLKQGKSVHGFSLRRGTDPHLNSMGPALITLYSTFGKIRSCESVFEAIEKKTVLSWNSMIAAFAQNGFSEKALELFTWMISEGFLPDSFTLANTLSSCGRIGEFSLGNQVHGVVTKTGSGASIFVQNSLLEMYSKCGAIDTASIIFKEIEGKDVVTWNTMINGLSQNGSSNEAISLFTEMHCYSLEIDAVTFLNAIRACTSLGSLTKGKWIHHKLLTSGLTDSHTETALVDMYAKCGDIETARRVFDSVPVKNVVSWSSIISGYGNHGMASEAIGLFSRMVSVGVRPNEVTFTGMLSACSHGGLVEEGLFYFHLMRDYGIDPQLDHCVSVVDLLTRDGQVDRAFNFIKVMRIEPSASICRALLNGFTNTNIFSKDVFLQNLSCRVL